MMAPPARSPSTFSQAQRWGDPRRLPPSLTTSRGRRRDRACATRAAASAPVAAGGTAAGGRKRKPVRLRIRGPAALDLDADAGARHDVELLNHDLGLDHAAIGEADVGNGLRQG